MSQEALEHSEDKNIEMASYRDKVPYNLTLIQLLKRAAFERIQGHNKVYYRTVDTIIISMVPSMHTKADCYLRVLKNHNYANLELYDKMYVYIVNLFHEAKILSTKQFLELGDDKKDEEQSQNYDIDKEWDK